MEDKTISVGEMYAFQKKLQEKYQVKWGEVISPEMSINKLCWAYGELAEAGDIIKKNRPEKVMADSELRRHLMEELGDAMMYMFDVMLCYGMTPEEFSEIYRTKCETNINRW